MARYLFVSYGQEGHLHPALPVAKALKERGHTVGYLTAPHKEETVRRAGLEYLRPKRWKASLEEAQGDNTEPDFISMVKDLNRVAHEIFFRDGLAVLEDLKEISTEFPADVVVGSQVTYGVPAFARLKNLVWATHCILPTYPMPSRDLFPWGLGKGLANTRTERLLAAALRAGNIPLTYHLVRHWRRTLRDLGIDEPRHTSLLDFTHSPYSYTVPSAPGFDLPRSDLPKQVRYVGTCLWHEGGTEATWENPFHDDKPLVYASAGTLFIGPEFYRRAIAAVAGQDFNMLAVIGRGVDPAIYGSLPPNVKLEAYVPQNPVMKKAAAVLCHGGGGTINSGLAQGVPTVCIPFTSDQPENALRVDRLGAGIFLPRAGCTPELVRDALRKVIFESRYRDEAARFAKVMAANDGPKNAADALEALAPQAEARRKVA